MGTHYRGTEHEQRALDTYIKLTRASTATERTINQHLVDADLSISQFGVLEALLHLGPLSLGRIAAKILKSGGNLTYVVDNLCKRGLVERQRDPDDGRIVVVHLTDDGHELIAGLFPRHVQRVVDAFEALSEAEQDALAALCKKLGRAQADVP